MITSTSNSISKCYSETQEVKYADGTRFYEIRRDGRPADVESYFEKFIMGKLLKFRQKKNLIFSVNRECDGFCPNIHDVITDAKCPDSLLEQRTNRSTVSLNNEVQKVKEIEEKAKLFLSDKESLFSEAKSASVCSKCRVSSFSADDSVSGCYAGFTTQVDFCEEPSFCGMRYSYIADVDIYDDRIDYCSIDRSCSKVFRHYKTQKLFFSFDRDERFSFH